MPDKGALLETGHMLFKELVAQPLREWQAVATRIAQEFCLAGRRPVCAERFNQHRTQPVHRRRLATHGGQAEDAVVIPQGVQVFAAGDPSAGFY